MTKPAVVLIGGDKGGVGKTTVARTLLDYFAPQQLRVRAFDTETPKGTLKRFHPDVTDVVDINHVPDQMRIFDTVNSTDAAVSLIDVRAGLLSARAAQHRVHRGGEEGRHHLCPLPHSRAFHRLTRRDRRHRRVSGGCEIFHGEEFHQQYVFLRMGRSDPCGVLQEDTWRGRNYHPKAR